MESHVRSCQQHMQATTLRTQFSGESPVLPLRFCMLLNSAVNAVEATRTTRVRPVERHEIIKQVVTTQSCVHSKV